MAGYFITLEGPDGSGKTTQAKLIKEWLESAGMEVVLTREPGGTPFGDSIRRILLDHLAEEEMNSVTELLMYESIRAHHVENVIRPGIARGAVVICDRFVDASTAYQGYGRGINVDDVLTLNRIATGGLMPNLTLLLDLKPEIGLNHAKADGREEAPSGGLDRIEAAGATFHRRVRRGYKILAKENPERIVMISRPDGIEETFTALKKIVLERLPKRLKKLAVA